MVFFINQNKYKFSLDILKDFMSVLNTNRKKLLKSKKKGE